MACKNCEMVREEVSRLLDMVDRLDTWDQDLKGTIQDGLRDILMGFLWNGRDENN